MFFFLFVVWFKIVMSPTRSAKRSVVETSQLKQQHDTKYIINSLQDLEY